MAFAIFAGAFILVGIASYLGYTLADRPLLFAAIAFLIGVVFSIGILVFSIASCVSEEIIYLAAETRNEAGAPRGDVVEASQTFGDLFDFYETTMRRRALSSVFFPVFGVSRALRKARMAVADPLMSPSLETIHKAGDELAHFCENLHESSYGRFYSHAKRFIIPDLERAHKADEAMDVFHRAVAELGAKNNFIAAHTACVESRRAGAMVHCAWPEYSQIYGNSSANLLRFRNDLRSVGDSINLLLSSTRDSEEAELLKKYSRSMARRFNALEALIKGDRRSVWRILRSNADFAFTSEG